MWTVSCGLEYVERVDDRVNDTADGFVSLFDNAGSALEGTDKVDTAGGDGRDFRENDAGHFLEELLGTLARPHPVLEWVQCVAETASDFVAQTIDFLGGLPEQIVHLAADKAHDQVHNHGLHSSVCGLAAEEPTGALIT